MPEKKTPAEILNEAVGRGIQRAINESLERISEIVDGNIPELLPVDYLTEKDIFWSPLPYPSDGPSVEIKPTVTEGPLPVRRQITDIDSIENRRRKVLEWQVRNVSHLKGLSNTKEIAVRRTIARGIRDGQTKKQLTESLMEKHGLPEGKAKIAAVNEIRRANSWAFRKTAYQLGYRMGKFRVHPGACEKCKRMNGALFSLTVEVIPDMTHPFCRCWMELSNVGYISTTKI